MKTVVNRQPIKKLTICSTPTIMNRSHIKYVVEQALNQFLEGEVEEIVICHLEKYNEACKKSNA